MALVASSGRGARAPQTPLGPALSDRPTPFLSNISLLIKELIFIFLFVVPAADVVLCGGGPKK